MEIVYFTVTAIILYFVADWILDRLEVMAGRRFEYRTLIFFALLAGFAVATFYLIRLVAGA